MISFYAYRDNLFNELISAGYYDKDKEYCTKAEIKRIGIAPSVKLLFRYTELGSNAEITSVSKLLLRGILS